MLSPTNGLLEGKKSPEDLNKGENINWYPSSADDRCKCSSASYAQSASIFVLFCSFIYLEIYLYISIHTVDTVVI